MSSQLNDIQIKQEIFDDFINKHEQENNVNGIEKSKQIISYLFFSKIKPQINQINELQTQMKQMTQKTEIDFKLKALYDKDRKRMAKIDTLLDQKRKKEAENDALLDKERKKRAEIDKEIKQLQNKINSNSKIKVDYFKLKCFDKFLIRLILRHQNQIKR